MPPFGPLSGIDHTLDVVVEVKCHIQRLRDDCKNLLTVCLSGCELVEQLLAYPGMILVCNVVNYPEGDPFIVEAKLILEGLRKVPKYAGPVRFGCEHVR